MTIQKHKNPMKDRTATAPYNFIPLADQPVVPETTTPTRNRYHTDRHTGLIVCTLTTMTPIYTRAALEADEYGKIDAKKKPDFFYVDQTTGEPVIPGSGLRGALRTLVEIITFGKLQPVTDRQLFYRTMDNSSIGKKYRDHMVSDGPAAMAGYISRHGTRYEIQPAKYYRVSQDVIRKATRNQSDKWSRVEIDYVPAVPIVTQVADKTHNSAPRQGWERGWLIASGGIPGKKHHWIVGPRENNIEPILLDEIDVEAYEELGAGITYGNAAFQVLSEHQGEQIPCFYIPWTDANAMTRIAFGHTPMFRLPYTHSPKDLLPQSHRDETVIDMAEAIFGRVVQNGDSVAGRVYVSDAHVKGEVPAKGESVNLLLSGPKPTAFQQYLVQQVDIKNELNHYESGADVTLRGHKLYWHRKDGFEAAKTEAYEAESKARGRGGHDSTQTTELRPVPENTLFEFTVRFENLSSAELGALLWALQPVGEHGVPYLHKVGMGKSVGLGSVRISPTLYLSSRLERYRTLFDTQGWTAIGGFSATGIESFTATFEEFILTATGLAKQCRHLRNVDRVQMLLTMMKWPGPNTESTNYLPLREFKQRHVLPDPLCVDNPELCKDNSSEYRQKAQSSLKIAYSSDEDRGKSPSKPDNTPKLATGVVKLTTIADVTEGILVVGVLDSFAVNSAVINLDIPEQGTLAYTDMLLPSKDRKTAQSIYSEGQRLRLRVKRIHPKTGKVQLYMHPEDNIGR